MIRVAIVDDHPIACRGVQQVLTESGRIDVVASAACPADLATALTGAGRHPDVIVLDLYCDGDQPCLEGVAGLSATTRVLVMSASGRPDDVLGAINAGAAGYVTKESSTQMFVAAVESVAAGGFALSAQLADILQAAMRSPGRGQHPSSTQPLSPREEQTLEMIARGLTHSQVASRLGVSKATVDTYVERIRTKLQVGNKAELTRAALQRRPASPAADH
ncbi:MAG: response regulator transcription factor [Actinomycetota bacterium]|nr:response regulator transcription factor [Actinomycetota bacterium]